MAIALPVEGIVDHHAFGRSNDAVVCWLEVARQRPGIGIDQPGSAVETLSMERIERTVRLEVVQLARADAGNENAPNVAPAVQFRMEMDHVRRLAVGRPGRRAAPAFRWLNG